MTEIGLYPLEGKALGEEALFSEAQPLFCMHPQGPPIEELTGFIPPYLIPKPSLHQP